MQGWSLVQPANLKRSLRGESSVRPPERTVFLLYQMGTSEDYTWYSVVGVFLSEKALMEYASAKSISADLRLLDSEGGDIVLPEPLEFVAVKTAEGEVPDVQLSDNIPPSTAAA